MVLELLAPAVLFNATGRCADDGLNVRFVVARISTDGGAVIDLTHAFFERDLSQVYYSAIGDTPGVRQQDYDRLMRNQ